MKSINENNNTISNDLYMESKGIHSFTKINFKKLNEKIEDIHILNDTFGNQLKISNNYESGYVESPIKLIKSLVLKQKNKNFSISSISNEELEEIINTSLFAYETQNYSYIGRDKDNNMIMIDYNEKINDIINKMNVEDNQDLTNLKMSIFINKQLNNLLLHTTKGGKNQYIIRELLKGGIEELVSNEYDNITITNEDIITSQEIKLMLTPHYSLNEMNKSKRLELCEKFGLSIEELNNLISLRSEKLTKKLSSTLSLKELNKKLEDKKEQKKINNKLRQAKFQEKKRLAKLLNNQSQVATI